MFRLAGWSSEIGMDCFAAIAVIDRHKWNFSCRPLPALRGADLVAVEHLIDTDSLAEESLVLTRCLQCINA
jgi:hypothetical protein